MIEAILRTIPYIVGTSKSNVAGVWKVSIQTNEIACLWIAEWKVHNVEKSL